MRRWRAVFEHRANFTYTHQLAPVYNEQIKADNPYIEVEDRLYGATNPSRMEPF